MELARRITVGLRSAPLLRIVEAKRRPEHGGIPKQPGLYAWWCDPTVVPGGAITTTHPEGLYELLYVGIAPGRANSKAELRGRLLRQHVGGNVGSSTFRFGLAALLWQRNGWMPGLSLGGSSCVENTGPGPAATASMALAFLWNLSACCSARSDPDVSTKARTPNDRIAAISAGRCRKRLSFVRTGRSFRPQYSNHSTSGTSSSRGPYSSWWVTRSHPRARRVVGRSWRPRLRSTK